MSGHTSGRSKPFETDECRFSYVKPMFFRETKRDDNGNVIKNKDGQEITEQTCTLIFPRKPEILERMMAPVHEAIQASSWGAQGLEMLRNKMIRLPFLAGDGKEARNSKTGELRPGMSPDVFFIRVATRQTAHVRYRHANIPAQYGTGPDEVKSGDYGFAVITAYTWFNAKNGNGVSFGIDYLQKRRDGESLGGAGGIDPKDYYQAVDPAQTAGLGSVDPAAMFSGSGAVKGSLNDILG